MEEARKFEEARLAEEAALQMAEIEKAKCKAAMEAAEAAQRLAEMESHRRRNAELKAKKEAAEKKRALDALAHNDVRYRKYTLDEIEAATNNFADDQKIGEGGYGPVYKALLDHTRVAIKVLRPDAAQGKKQFQQEVCVLKSLRPILDHALVFFFTCPILHTGFHIIFQGFPDLSLLLKYRTNKIQYRLSFQIKFLKYQTGYKFIVKLGNKKLGDY